MQTVSARFLAALRESRLIATVVDVYYNGSLTLSNMPVIDGSISVDRTSKVRRGGTITVGDPTLFPTYWGSPLAPYGTEINIRSGISFADKTEYISLGWFRVQKIEQETAYGQQGGRLPIISFVDRSQGIADGSFLDPRDGSGQDVQTLITTLVHEVYPSVTVTFAGSLGTARTAGGTVFDSDRQGAIDQCCEMLGAESYFDTAGNFQVVPVPTLTQSTPVSASVWNMDASTAAAIAAGASSKGVLVQAKRAVSREGVFNGVAVYGTATGSNAAPTGYAYDTDPKSPTMWGGTFGKVTKRVSNNLLTTSAQCNTAAASILANTLGLARSLSFTTCPNPALEAGDIVQAIYPDGKTELHIVDRFTIPLGFSGQFSGSTRTLTYQVSGGTATA